MRPSAGARNPATAEASQLRAVKAAPQIVVAPSSSYGSTASRVKRCTFAGQSVRCQAEPGRYGSWFPGVTSTGTPAAARLSRRNETVSSLT